MIRVVGCVLAALAFSSPCLAQDALREVVTLEGDHAVSEVPVWVNLPADHDPQLSYPILLALPPGSGDQSMVQAGLGNYWQAEGRRRGYLVVSVQLFGRKFGGRAAAVIEGALAIAARHGGDRERVVLAGFSNGGIGAFIALVETWDQHPFKGLIGLPGALPLSLGVDDLDMTGFPVLLLVGETDRLWVVGVEKTAQTLEERGAMVACEILPGQGHVVRVEPSRLFDWIDGVLAR